MTNTKRSAPRYLLGTKQGNREFLFTDLGTFRSGLEASEYWRSQPRNGVAYIYEERDVSRHGVVFGIERTIVATA
jgi:hypothetical protein